MSLSNLSSLSILDLMLNQLEGAIPTSLGVLKDLWFLGLAFNNLFGEPPVSLYNLSSLEMLQIQGNMLNGSIPTDIGSRFPNIQINAVFWSVGSGLCLSGPLVAALRLGPAPGDVHHWLGSARFGSVV